MVMLMTPPSAYDADTSPRVSVGRKRSKRLVMQLGDHVGDQRAPAGLVRGAEPLAGVAVVVFVEQDAVPEMRIGLHLLVVAEDRAPALLVAPEDVDQAAAQVVGDVLQRQHAARADRPLELQAVAAAPLELAPALDHH